MKKRNLIYVTCMLIAMGACSATSKNQAEVVTDTWGKYNVGTILFEDKAPETKGSDVYHRIIPDAESYIKAQAREVLATLYNSPDDSIPKMYPYSYIPQVLHYNGSKLFHGLTYDNLSSQDLVSPCSWYPARCHLANSDRFPYT